MIDNPTLFYSQRSLARLFGNGGAVVQSCHTALTIDSREGHSSRVVPLYFSERSGICRDSSFERGTTCILWRTSRNEARARGFLFETPFGSRGCKSADALLPHSPQRTRGYSSIALVYAWHRQQIGPARQIQAVGLRYSNFGFEVVTLISAPAWIFRTHCTPIALITKTKLVSSYTYCTAPSV
jgi:hypothetical protein